MLESTYVPNCTIENTYNDIINVGKIFHKEAILLSLTPMKMITADRQRLICLITAELDAVKNDRFLIIPLFSIFPGLQNVDMVENIAGAILKIGNRQ